MKLMATALAVLCGGQLAGAQEAQWLGPPKTLIQVGTVEATMAYEPGIVTIEGAELGLVEQVLVNGVPVRIVENNRSTMTIEPEPQHPGFAKLELVSPRQTVVTEIEFMPSLSVTRVGESLQLMLHAGEPGPYWVFYSLDTLPSPFFYPGVYDCGWLDMTSSSCGLAASGFWWGGPVSLSTEIPPGYLLPVYFQAVCLYNTEAEAEWSFSNATELPPTHAWDMGDEVPLPTRMPF